MNQFFSALLCTSLLCIANLLPATVYAAAPISFEILAERTHKPTLFTQGLLVDGDHFYESSGLYNQSLLVTYPIAEPAGTWAKISALFTKKQPVPARYFAEGLALLGDKLYLLTWQEQTLLIYDKTTLNYQKSLSYKGEGWGLTTDGKQLIRSDGSDTLYFHTADDFTVTKTLKITDEGKAVAQLNELEFVEGFIWANVWHQDRILKIDPATGKVLGEMDLSGVKQKLQLNNSEQVLNGIAWDEKRNAFWITGKNWPKMFLLRIRP
ncbi:MAG: glutaminyl-peptide cyclotransferase [Cellvibrio sp.]|uniref:glutaminyl-peptide cyclotransferase n=1 Tax=Cellvibrio sp. TaxID=1965322 RepID=UPI00271D5BC8|nr:glutaminyl-peptide cyclotransferase [Cellvibrio sp.]